MLDVSKYDVGSSIGGKASVREGKTTPPRAFVEGDLILIMDDIGRYANIGKEDMSVLKEKNKSGSGKAGIGTARTRGEIIKKLLEDGYFEKKLLKGKKLPIIVPTQKSMDLYDRLSNCGSAQVLVSPEMTAKWEIGLAKIESGDITIDQFMGQLYKFVAQMTVDMTAVPTNPYFGKPRGEGGSGSGSGRSNCDEKHEKDGQICEQCKVGSLFTMKVIKPESKSFGNIYVKCDNKKCSFFGNFVKV
jgi:hypothetical protein